jgi:hypothetical protein
MSGLGCFGFATAWSRRRNRNFEVNLESPLLELCFTVTLTVNAGRLLIPNCKNTSVTITLTVFQPFTDQVPRSPLSLSITSTTLATIGNVTMFFWEDVGVFFSCWHFVCRNGRWRSVWSVEKGGSKLTGSAKVQVHYYEDGNVQLNSTKDFELEISSEQVWTQ